MRFNFLGLQFGFGAQPKDGGSEEKASGAAPYVYLMYQGNPDGVWYKRNPAQYSDDAYKRNVIAFKAINEVARGAAKIPLKVMVGDKEADANHPLVKLLAKPNPWQSHASFFEAVVAFWLLSGNTYLEGVGPDNAPPLELWCLRPDRTKVVPGPMGPAGYTYSINGQIKRWDLDPVTGAGAILHMKFFHPLDDWYGMSPVEAAAYSVDAHNMAGEWNQGLLQNGARPSGALVYKGQNGGPNTLSEKQYESLKEQLNGAYSGTRNAGRPMLLEGGLEWQAMSLTPSEMDWLQGKHNSAREIALAFGVPPQCLGIPGDNTYSNYQEARQALYQDTIIPLLESLCDGLNGWLCPLFGEGVRIVPHVENLHALADVRAKRWEAVQAATWMTTNEKRQAVGMDVLDGKAADEVLISSAVVPLSQVSEIPDGDETLPAGEDGEVDDDLADDGATVTTGPKPVIDPAAADQVQGTALNGAQITALAAIVQAVAAGEMSVDAAEALIRISFPAVAASAIADLTRALEAMAAKPKPVIKPEPKPPEPPGTKPPVVPEPKPKPGRA